MRSRREKVYLTVMFVLIGLWGQSFYRFQRQPDAIRVYYNRDTRANDHVIQAIQQADKFIYFAVYTFTRNDIKDALLGAHHRGVEIMGITDRKQMAASDQQARLIDELRAGGIPVTTQNHSALMHLKVLVTEKSYVSGSYNWTEAGTAVNDEVIEVGHNENVRLQYEKTVKKIIEKYNKD